ncbi:single-stranded-DNA-specific exonuclease RecJ [Thermodesulforhabdus norvegica]|uniref:Single-stranded-DNA-specific exonuclease RecJ n=1 Tax=Thermodesulforhabdus norvegica TaxID=39841 RepID=A0A1I4UMU4_9BACT|nr:DHHA1 domain-containing protein [Thermodesulforhabdus norvegica]SFM90231.1 single-stranded-DNA-specific exonuclease [Thermodesulforhabdus norvegica]
MISPEWVINHRQIPSDVDEVISILVKSRAGEREDEFLHPHLSGLKSYMEIKNLDEGARLLVSHLERGHRVVLVGDYDCDGITSIAQLVWFFRDIGYGNFETIIPTREEGYGIPLRALEQHAGAPLFLAVDCGTHDVEMIGALKDSGSDVVVIDHHEVTDPSRIAPATVLINPKQPGCPSRFKDLCSSGLTLLFLIRVRQMLDGRWPYPTLDGRYQSLAALGTIADVMPLTGANRIIAKAGLERINEDRFPPIRILRDVAGLSSRTINAGSVGFYLAPRINAAGRVGDPATALSLLTATEIDDMNRAARELNRLNTARQLEESKILRRISMYLKTRRIKNRTLVIAGRGWHPGVVGIVASRVIQNFHYGPVIIGTVNDEGVVRASGRSIPGFDICRALQECDEFLIRWGGHEAAAGLTLHLDMLSEFRKKFEAFASGLPGDIFIPKLNIDLEIPRELIRDELVDHLSLFEPHGPGNPLPLFVTRNCLLENVKPFGTEERHLSLSFAGGLKGIVWRARDKGFAPALTPGVFCDVAYHLELDPYTDLPRMIVRDVKIRK